MTVCIAVQCQYRGSTCFVLCSDARLEDETAGGDVALKISPGRENWVHLIAGIVPRAQEYLAVCNESVYFGVESEGEAIEALRAASRMMKERLVREYLNTKWSMTLEDFRKIGQEHFPPDVYARIHYEIEQTNIDCEVIVTGFAGSTPVLCLVKPSGEVSPRSGFATAGTGGLIAQAWLFQRQYKWSFPIEAALYCAYEAKRLSESAPGVGEMTHIAVFGPLRRIDETRDYHAEIRFVSESGVAELEEQFVKLHPQELSLPEFNPAKYFSSAVLWQ